MALALALRLALIALLHLLLVHGASSNLRQVPLEQVSLEELQAPSREVRRSLARGLAQVGVFAVSLPGGGGADAVQQALKGYAGCASSGSVELPYSILGDGSRRTSLAVAVNASVAEQLPQEVQRACPHFSTSSVALRHLADQAGAALAGILDSMVKGSGTADSAGEFATAVAKAESLEHFHMYRSHPKATHLQGGCASLAALDLHTDLGLFLVMAPAALLHVDTLQPVLHSAPGAGLHLRLPGGEVVQPVVPPGSLLVMMGEAANRWMHLPPSVTLYAPPHEVVVPQVPGSVRAWYGRMYMPLRSSVLVDGNATWNEYRHQTMQAFLRGAPEEASTAGCGDVSLGQLLSDEQTCAHGEVYCWMTCMSAAKLAPDCSAAEALCSDPKGKLWPDQYIGPDGKPLHCFDCTLKCPEKPPPPASAEAVCNNNLTATVMWMTGFKHVRAGQGQPCIAYLFDWFVLDSWLKLACGILITALLGVAVEYIVYARRQMMANPVPVKNTTAGKTQFYTVVVLVYTLQVALGYLLMLVAMTYQAELFVAVVAGLSLGHAIFNAKGPVLDSADACCMGLDPQLSPALSRRTSTTLSEALLATAGAAEGNGHQLPSSGVIQE